MNTEVELTKKRFPCSYCEYSSDHKHDLIKHERTHTGEKPFKCKHCDKLFAQRRHLVRHERSHTGEKPYSCKKCNKPFARSDSYKIHEKKCQDLNVTEIEEDLSTEKSICEKAFEKYKKIHNDSHQIGSHDKKASKTSKVNTSEIFYVREESIKCNVCDKVFVNPTSLEIHKWVHPAVEIEDALKYDQKTCTDSEQANHKDDHNLHCTEIDVKAESREDNIDENICEDPLRLEIETGDSEKSVKQEVKEESESDISNDPLL